jgi:hypothetical protein
VASRVAVVTDAASERFIFPFWYRYYGGLFGCANLFVVTYSGLCKAFAGFDLGGVVELPVGYDDAVRRDVLTGLVSALLPCYDFVVRVDADEFLVVDPRVTESLASFLETFAEPYLTSRGFDVVQLPQEAPLPEGLMQILPYRQVAYPNSALNKTCIVKTAVKWSSGFHSASVYPKFGPLFLLHMKRVDIQWQLQWFARMTANIKDNANVAQIIKDYYEPDIGKITKYHREVSGRTRLSGIDSWYRQEFTRQFLDGVALRPADGVYAGTYGHEHVLCEIPSQWRALI